MSTLARAMRAVDDQAEYAETMIEEAVANALAASPQTLAPAVKPQSSTQAIDDPAAQRQRDLDAALADAVEVVARHRARLGRRVCSRHDGAVIRQVFETLRGMAAAHEGGADNDASFQ